MIQDLRFAARRLASRLALTVLMVIVLALGIGANTAVLTIVDQTIFRPVPFAHADRLFEVSGTTPGGGGGSILTPEKILEWQTQPVFERFEGHAGAIYDLTGDGDPERVEGRIVTVGLFGMLGAAPQLGRSRPWREPPPSGARGDVRKRSGSPVWRRCRHFARDVGRGHDGCHRAGDHGIPGELDHRS